MSLLFDTVEARVRTNLKSFEQHTLKAETTGTPSLLGAGTRAYYIGEPGTATRSFVVAAAGGHLFVAGDACCPSNGNGFVSAAGYGIDWFAGELSPDYLCEKFLRKDFQPDYALDWLADVVKDAVDDRQAFLADNHEDDDWYYDDANELDMREKLLGSALADLRERNECGELSEDAFRAAVSEAARGLLDEGLPLAYNTDDAVMLVTVQRVFARLYAELAKRSDQTSLYTSGTSVPKDVPK